MIKCMKKSSRWQYTKLGTGFMHLIDLSVFDGPLSPSSIKLQQLSQHVPPASRSTEVTRLSICLLLADGSGCSNGICLLCSFSIYSTLHRLAIHFRFVLDTLDHQIWLQMCTQKSRPGRCNPIESAADGRRLQILRSLDAMSRPHLYRSIKRFYLSLTVDLHTSRV